MPMNCVSTQELLPWYLNRTLSEDDSRIVREHLAHCADCRRELELTREARAVFDTHIPSETLVDHAWDRPTDLPTEMLETHLAECRACGEELSLLRQSRYAEELAAEEPPVPVGSTPEAAAVPWRSWLGRARWLPLAASLLAVVSLTGWLTSQARLADLRAQIAQEPAAATAETPTSTLWDQTVIVALAPVLPTRGEADGLFETDAYADSEAEAERVVLSLFLEDLAPEAGPFRVELLDAEDRVLATFPDRGANTNDEILVPVSPTDLAAGEPPVAVRVTAVDGTEALYGSP